MQKLLKLHKSLLKYLVAATLLSVPLFPKFPFVKIPGTFVSIRIEDFVISITAIVCLFYIFPKYKELLVKPWSKSISIYIAVGFVSLLSAIVVTNTVIPHIGFLHWLRRIEYFIPLFLGFTILKIERKNIYFYLNLLILITILSFIYGIGQKYFNWPIIITQNQEFSKGVALRWVPGSHLNATFAGHYDLATFLVLILPIFISSLFIFKGLKTRLLLSVTVLSGLWLLVNTASRISLVSYLLGSVLALFFIRKYLAIPVIVFVSLVFIFFSSNLQVRYQRLFDVTIEKIKEIVDVRIVANVYAQENNSLPQKREKGSPTPTVKPVFEDRSTSIRLNVEWPRAIRSFTKNPLLGTGFSSITLATDNDFLRLLGEVGILGFLSFLLILVRISIPFIAAYPFGNNLNNAELAIVAGLSGAFPGLLLNAVFIDIFEASKFAILFWFIVGLALSVVDINKNEQYD